ncbi:hypothetical protein RJ639_028222, partial [Escallonia herrerae]
MVPSKSKPHLSVASFRENDETVVEALSGKSAQSFDHWAFLDEIEAPMWVDLTSETTSSFQDNDNEWFHVSHPFHECSARHLISAFSHSGEVCTSSIPGLQEPTSPRLPPSVSRSRGKHYKSKEWGQSNFRVALNKQHPPKSVRTKTILVNSGAVKEVKPKPRNESTKGHTGSKANLVCTKNLTASDGLNHLKKVSSCADSNLRSRSTTLKESESNSMSTITFEGSEQQQQNFREVSSKTFSHSRGLSLARRISPKKRCVTRQASRVMIDGGRKSEGRKSSSSKSSVGSSSNPGFDGKRLAPEEIQYKDNTPDSRNVIRVSQAPKNKWKVANGSKAHAVQVQNIALNSVCRYGTIKSKSTNQETFIAKVPHRAMRAKALVPPRCNEQDSPTYVKVKDKFGVGRHIRYTVGGKENAFGIISESSESDTNGKESGGTVQNQKASNWSLTRKSEREKLVVTKGKVNGRNEGKIYGNVVQKVYL